MKRKIASNQVEAAFRMGGIEGRVSINDETLRPGELIKYINDAETAEMMASNAVLDFIQAKDYLSSKGLKKRYIRYKSKYWKS